MMLTFVPVLSFSEEIFRAYSEAFPPDERRDKEQFSALFSNPKVQVLSIQIDEISKGYLIVWKLSECLFLEHFEVFPQFRGQNIGSKVLAELRNIYSIIILESEPDFLNEIAKKRIDFYKKNGFKILDKNYIQPAYSSEKESINLFLMSNVSSIQNLDLIIKEIHRVVYDFV